MTIAGRQRGWLNQKTDLKIREEQFHVLARYDLLCPVYCLMPDHMHFLWMGMEMDSVQLNAAQFFRRYVNEVLEESNVRLQGQGFDHVLRGEEQRRSAFESLLFYIVENPVRAGLVDTSHNWPYSGTQVAGYPDLDWRDDDFRERFWKIYGLELEKRVKHT